MHGVSSNFWTEPLGAEKSWSQPAPGWLWLVCLKESTKKQGFGWFFHVISLFFRRGSGQGGGLSSVA